jgi:hypothetical protein
MTGEATADRKRKRVKVHDTLVTVLRGSFKKRKGLDGLSVGGWEYTFYALLHEYLHEASGGHAAGTKEAQRVTQDLDRRSIATAITVEEGAHTVRHDKETNVHQRPSYRTMTEKAYPAFNLLQCVLAFKRALAETDFTRGPDGKLGRLLANSIQFDGTQIRNFHIMAGHLVTFTQYIIGEDAFGTPVMAIKVFRSNLIPVQCVNKISTRVRNSMTGKLFQQETSRGLALQLLISGVAPALDTMYFSFDGAMENSGGDRSNMFGVTSVLYSLLATREPWEEVDKFLDDSGIGPLLKRLYALEDLEGLCKELNRILRQEKTARSQASKAKAAAKNAKSNGSTNHAVDLTTGAGRPATGISESPESSLGNPSDPGGPSQAPHPPSPTASSSQSPERDSESESEDSESQSADESENSVDDEESELSSAAESDSETSQADPEPGSEQGSAGPVQGVGLASPHLRNCPKIRAAPHMLDTSAKNVTPAPACFCRRRPPLCPCHDNCECIARYVMGKGFDFYGNPEQYEDYDCYGPISGERSWFAHNFIVRNESEMPEELRSFLRARRNRSTALLRAILVKCRCWAFVRDLRTKRYLFLVWSCWRGKTLRDLGVWAEVEGDAVADNASRDEQDKQDRDSVVNAALDKARLSKPKDDSTDAAKAEYKKGHARRLEARLFLIKLGSITDCKENGGGRYITGKENGCGRNSLSLKEGKRFCMPVNPLCFLPCVDQRPGPDDENAGFGCRINGAEQCSMHRIHNSSKKHCDVLNDGLNQTLVHATKWVMVPYYAGPLETAIVLMFCEEGSDEAEARDAATAYYRLVVDAIDEQHKAGKGVSMIEIRLEMGYDPDNGFGGVRTCCELRWGSVGHAAGELFPMTRPLALAILRRFAFGTDEAKTEAAVAIASHRGFIPSEHPRIKLEAHAQRVFAFCTRTQDLLQLAIMRLVYNLSIRLFLIHGSSNHECGTHAMMGLNSVVRNVLLVLSRDIWVAVRGARRGRPNGPWTAKGRGRGPKLANPFRTDGAEFAGGPSIRLLNPACGPKVAKTLDFACDELAKHAIPEFVHSLRQFAMREGEVLPEDTLAAYNTAYSTRAAELAVSGSTEAIKMSQMQFLLRIVLDDVTAATRSQMLREFFGIKGILAGMTETERSSKFVYVRDPTRPGAPKELFIVSASAFAMAHAAAFAIGARDLMHEMEPQLQGGDLTDFLPTYGAAMSNECRQQAEEFAGIRKWNDDLRVEHGRGLDVRTLPQIQGCGIGENQVDGQQVFDRPLQLFKRLHKAASIAQFACGSSKGVESSMSTPCAMAKTKPRLNYATLVHLMRRGFFLHADNKEFLERVGDNRAVMFWAASKVGQLPGWKKVFAKDTLRCDTMHDNYTMQDPKKMPASVRRGGVWQKSDSCFLRHSRTNKFATPKTGSEEDRKKKALILKIVKRKSGHSLTGEEVPRPPAVAGDKHLQSIARAVRAKQGGGKARSVSRPQSKGTKAAGGSAAGGPARRSRSASAAPDRQRGVTVAFNGSVGGPVGSAERGRGRGRQLQTARKRAIPGKSSGGEAGLSVSGSKGEDYDGTHASQDLMAGGDDSDQEWVPNKGDVPRPAEADTRVTRGKAREVAHSSGGVISAGDDASTPARVLLGAASAAADAVSGVNGLQQGGPASESAISPLAGVPLQAAAPGICSADMGHDSDNEPLFPERAVSEEPPSNETALEDSAHPDDKSDEVPTNRLNTERSNDDSNESADSDDSEDEDLDDAPLAERTRKLKMKQLPDTIANNKAWSLGFCFDLHNYLWNKYANYTGPWLESSVQFENDSISVTRRPQKFASTEFAQCGIRLDLKICFNLSVGDDDAACGHFFIMFDEHAGAMLIDITSTAKPAAPKKQAAGKAIVAAASKHSDWWASSAKYRRAYRATEAMNRTDSKRDKKHTIGEDSLKKFAEAENEEKPESITYHVGDCEYTGDLRNIIGVVRWFPASYRDSKSPSPLLAREKWPYPHADLVFVGPRFSEKASKW